MNCPRCGELLCNIKYEGIEVETCPQCKGEWLDAEELKHIVKTVDKTFLQEELISLEAINRSIISEDDSPENELKCPKCDDVQLVRLVYATTTGICLDKCMQCRGIWLDDAELEKVQILCEEWKKKLGEDFERFGPVLEKIRQRHEEAEERQTRLSRIPFVNSILKHLID